MIYFVQPIDGGPVKIGFTENLGVRLAQLEAHYRKPLAILATMDGDRDTEKAIHKRFAHLRFGRTEQFQPDPDLMNFIGLPLFVNASPVEEMSPRPQSGVPVRLAEDALRWARRASGMTGESVPEYISRVVAEQGEWDFNRFAEALRKEQTKKGKP